MRKNKLIIWYAIVLQFVTAIFVLTSEGMLRVARLGVFYDLFNNHQLGAIIMLVSVALALIGLTFNKSKLSFLLFLPQFSFLLMNASSALYYIMIGRYADGVIRSSQFIFIDQLPSIIAAVIYTVAIFDFRKEKYYVTQT